MRTSSARDPRSRRSAPLINITGKLLMFVGISLLIPAAVALYYGENVHPFIFPAMFCLIISAPMIMMFKGTGDLRMTDGLFFVAALWIVLISIGSVPYLIMGFPAVDAVFEATSGFTTTGSTILADFDQPNSLFIWRALTVWFGGITIILVFMAILPLLGMGGRSTFMNELSGSDTKNYSSRMKDTVRQFVTIYAMLTAVMIIACLILGVDAMGSVCLSMSTISIGGFLNVHSMTVYPAAVQMVTMFFMVMGGTNFYLHFRAIYRRDIRGYFRNTEFRTMVIWLLAASLILFMIVAGASGWNDFSLSGYKDVLFTAVSIGTTTGFLVGDFTLWPAAALFLLLIMMFFGASSGSTSGGVKLYRGIILLKYLRTAVLKTIHPRAVFDIKMDGTSVSENAVTSSMAVILLFLMTIAVGSIAAMAMGFDAVHALSATVSQLTNAGPACNSGDTFAHVSSGHKILFSVLMWVGRLEIVLALVLLAPSFWKEFLRRRPRSV